MSVITLVGERGREVHDFLEGSLGEEGLKRSVVVCATSNEPAGIELELAEPDCECSQDMLFGTMDCRLHQLADGHV